MCQFSRMVIRFGFSFLDNCFYSPPTVITMQIVIIHVISWLPRYIIYEPLANARMKGFKTWDDDEAKRFSQTATSLLFFCSSAVFAYRVLSPEEWLYSTSGWYSMSNSTYLQPAFKFYYLLYIARFSSDLISLFFESRKKVRRRAGEYIRCTMHFSLNAALPRHIGCIYCIIHSPLDHHYARCWFR